MKIIMDIVINHTSTEHEWFQASLDPLRKIHSVIFIFGRMEQPEDRRRIGNQNLVDLHGSMTKPRNNITCTYLMSTKQI